MGEAFEMMKAESKIKREMNRQTSPEVLTAAGIAFTSHNFGAHLLLCGNKVSFWPGTGLWIDSRTTPPKKGRGVRKLINHIKGSAA